MDPLVAGRDAILERATRHFAAEPDIAGAFLSGSLADGSADRYSDLDLRVVVFNDAPIDARAHAPMSWGDFLFHEHVGPDVTVSQFAPGCKVDVVYYAVETFAPNPWLALPVEILFEKDCTVSRVVEASRGLSFGPADHALGSHLAKAVSCISEATKCLRRGEPVYASHLAKRVVETLLRVEDRGHDRPPIGLSRVDTRASEGLLDLAASLAGAVDPPSVARSVGVASGAVRSAIVAVHDMGDIDERLRDALLAGLTLSEAL